MSKSTARRRKQPTRRPARPAAREARTPLPGASAAPDDDFDNADEWDDQDDAALDDTESEQPGEDAAPPARGVVRTATRARGRVPFLLDEVIRADVAVRRAERELGKAVARARAHGATWDEVGLATRMTRQGATKRWR